MPAEFLSNLPKNLTTHLTHKLYSVFPKMYVCKKTLDFFHKTCYNNYAVFENDFYIF